ncbi:uncharacterized protein Bfra_011043 [Botrytis fragariae]|uniref:Uncharacterized protein n=1 Tax=Botrytis fragariae TaxID=1964551 RepID=A0A8H6ALC4_9HELO|nr:uncharacterized protein Bfra_011043 [Botrytis fragariae]KAF5869843.1 hypothetical protein Bfra_011043 [Botrytis fragariae]
MAEKRRRREHQNIASGGSSSTGAPRSDSSPSFLNSIDTLGAQPISLYAPSSSHRPLGTRSPHVSLPISSKVNAPDGSATGCVGGKPIAYIPKASQDEGRKGKDHKPGTTSKSARASSPTLSLDNKPQDTGPLHNLRYLKWYMGPRSNTENLEPRERQAQQHLRGRLNRAALCINTHFPKEDEETSIKSTHQRIDSSKPSKIKEPSSSNKIQDSTAKSAPTTKPTLTTKPSLTTRTTSNDKNQDSTTKPALTTKSSLTAKPTATLKLDPPQKFQNLPLKQNYQMSEKSHRQTQKPIKVDTLSEKLQGNASTPSSETSLATKYYRELYLPSIGQTSCVNKMKEPVGPALQSSAPKMGSSLSAPRGLSSTPTSAPALAEAKCGPVLAASHPSVTDPKDNGSFQTPGAVPYNLTPSPPDSGQESDYCGPYGGRSTSPSDHGFNVVAESPTALELGPTSVPANEKTPTQETKAASPATEEHSPDRRNSIDTKMQNTGDIAQSPKVVNHATSANFETERPGSHILADEEMQDLIDLTEPNVITGAASLAFKNPTAHTQSDEEMWNAIDLTGEKEMRDAIDLTGEDEEVQKSIEQDEDMPDLMEDKQSHVECRPGKANHMGSSIFRPADSTESEIGSEPEPEAEAEVVQRKFEEQATIDLTLSRSPTPKLDDLPRHINQISAGLASSRINKVVAGKNRVYAHENRYHNSDGRAPSADLVGSKPNDKVQIDNSIKDEFVDNQNELQVIASPEENGQSSKLANDELPRKSSGRNQRIPLQSKSSTKHVGVVQSPETDDSVEASASSQGDAMEIDECTEIGTPVEAATPGEAKKKRKGKRRGKGKGKGKGKGDAKNANDQNTTHFDDRQFGSDLAQIPSDSEQDPLKDQSDRIMSEAEIKQAILDALTVPVFPKAPPESMVTDEKAYKLAKEGEYFTLSHALFSVVPKEVYDRIWKDEYERPQISLSTKTPKWIRPLDPTIKHPAKPETNSTELIKVLCEIEKLLISVWVGVESIVVVLYSELDDKFTSRDLDEYFRVYQVQIYDGWTDLHAHLLTLADWKDRYFAIANIKKRAARPNADPYARLFTIKNPSDLLFYGNMEYLKAMKAAMKAAEDANDCVMMKGPKWKHMIGMNKTVMGEEFSKCLDGLRKFNSYVRKRDWDVPGAHEDDALPPMIASKLATKNASKQVSSKGKEVAVEDVVQENSGDLSDGDPPGCYEASSKYKGKQIVVEDDTEETSSDVSDGDPPYYEEDDDEDNDYVEARSHRRRSGPKLSVQPPTPTNRRASGDIPYSSSRRISSGNEMKLDNGNRASSTNHSSRHLLPKDGIKPNNERGASSGSNAMKSSYEFTRGHPIHRAGSIVTPTSVKTVKKGAKRLMVEVGPSSSPNDPEDYFETP